MKWSELSLRDRGIIVTVGFVLAYFVLVMMWFLSQSMAWDKARKSYERAHKERVEHETLISQRERWVKDYEKEASLLPSFPEGKAVDTHWMARIDVLAASNHVTIAARQALENSEEGDVCELAIDVKNYEASLHGLVGFIYALEHDKEGMFDVKELRIQPGGRNRGGVLKGNMRISCAYLRSKK